ncbi:hypothetical protein CDL15_Pgr007572 [Punica granatum]|uniref:Uncharacterized protein n=1 Tax=Punica granatum TaxID=22663 RepID=A0A218X9F9_PUNGR|nr:hypothetical protein CDL15_Pgr007572 [Punica granatum]PKI41079.1 hypothetical protein CRG98_038607 [Punica granatum]
MEWNLNLSYRSDATGRRHGGGRAENDEGERSDQTGSLNGEDEMRDKLDHEEEEDKTKEGGGGRRVGKRGSDGNPRDGPSAAANVVTVGSKRQPAGIASLPPALTVSFLLLSWNKERRDHSPLPTPLSLAAYIFYPSLPPQPRKISKSPNPKVGCLD